jgi:hypothetical protein
MPLRSYLMAIAIFANEVKGKSMLAMARDLGVAYQTSFVLAHTMREAMSAEVRQTAIGGEGKRAEVDGGYFGGYVKRPIVARIARIVGCGRTYRASAKSWSSSASVSRHRPRSMPMRPVPGMP